MEANNANKDVVYPELSFKIIGAAFSVFNELGWGLSEKQYQQALAKELTDLGISFKGSFGVWVHPREASIGISSWWKFAFGNSGLLHKRGSEISSYLEFSREMIRII